MFCGQTSDVVRGRSETLLSECANCSCLLNVADCFVHLKRQLLILLLDNHLFYRKRIFSFLINSLKLTISNQFNNQFNLGSDMATLFGFRIVIDLCQSLKKMWDLLKKRFFWFLAGNKRFLEVENAVKSPFW